MDGSATSARDRLLAFELALKVRALLPAGIQPPIVVQYNA